jgi:hypothetical protein
MDPLVAVTVTVLVPVGDFGPELLEQAGISKMLNVIKQSRNSPSIPSLRGLGRRKWEPPRLNTIPITPVPSKAEKGRCAGDPCCEASMVPSPGLASLALVFVVMVSMPVATPEETVTLPPLHEVFAGRPLHVTVTAPVNPFAGVTVMVVEPALPRAIVSAVGFRVME